MRATEQAVQNFTQGDNCAQAVLKAFCQSAGMAEEEAGRVASALGGGARCGELCGAVSGALLAIGLHCDRAGRSQAVAEEFLARFRQRHESVVCKELLGYDVSTPQGKQQRLTAGRRDCTPFVASAAEITQELLEE